MELTLEKIEQLSKLYNFRLSDQEIVELQSEFKQLSEDMKLLAAIDTEQVAPMVYPFEQPTSYLREDDDVTQLSQQQVLANAPQTVGDFIVVPKVVE